jgi:hypothetical protein
VLKAVDTPAKGVIWGAILSYAQLGCDGRLRLSNQFANKRNFTATIEKYENRSNFTKNSVTI